MRSFLRFLGLAAAALLLLSSQPARADITWNVPSGDWSVATNWSGGAAPTSTDNADIFNGGTVTITESPEVCSTLSLGNTAGSGFAEMLDGSLTVNASLYYNGEFVGSSGIGCFTQSGGTHTIFTYLEVGAASGSSGTYSLGKSGLLSAPTEQVGEGYGAVGFFTQTGGTNSAGNLTVGCSTASSGTYNLNG